MQHSMFGLAPGHGSITNWFLLMFFCTTSMVLQIYLSIVVFLLLIVVVFLITIFYVFI